MTTPSNLYIPGLPSKLLAEQIGDCCLPVCLWGGRTVEILENDQVHYDEHECLYEMFAGSMGFLKAYDLDFCCALPTMLALGAGTLLTSAVALPFELVGRCFKNCALASNPSSKAYNDLARKHLFDLREKDISPQRIERLKSKLEIDKAHVSFLEKIQDLFPRTTRRLPKSVKYEDLSLMIKPIVFEKEVTDYEISGTLPGLPTTKSKVANNILIQKKSIESIETLIAEKSELFKSASEKFIQDAKALNNESIPLLSRSDDEYQ